MQTLMYKLLRNFWILYTFFLFSYIFISHEIIIIRIGFAVLFILNIDITLDIDKKAI